MASIRVCIAGATGRMGRVVVQEALARGFDLIGAVADPQEKAVGKSLRELEIGNADIEVVGSDRLNEALKGAEVYISFTKPEAEVKNLPVVVRQGVRVLMGTTGFNEEQRTAVEEAVRGKVPALFSPNFSLGVNILFKILDMCKLFPQGYDFSLVEAHHTGKADAPSGTAKKMADIISNVRGYRERVHGREGISKRRPGEMEVLSVRVGGVLGIHELIIAGQHEMMKIEHTAFSRRVFAQGVLYAAEWLLSKTEPKIYTMDDLLTST